MPSSALRLRDLRAVYELAHECRDLGDDFVAWRQHLIAGLARLTGAGLAISGEMFGCRAGRVRLTEAVEWGWGNGFDRGRYLEGMARIREDPNCYQLFNHYLEQLRAKDGVTLTRADLIRDREWYRAQEFQGMLRGIGADHTLWCFRSLSPAPRDEYSAVILYRPVGEPNFRPRSLAVVREAHIQFAPLIGTALARFGEPAPSGLAPRARAVLRCLLEGDSDKQVAARLGISKYTVNQYVKVVFDHFGVATRAELLARWVRRGWGNGFAWANEE